MGPENIDSELIDRDRAINHTINLFYPPFEQDPTRFHFDRSSMDRWDKRIRDFGQRYVSRERDSFPCCRLVELDKSFRITKTGARTHPYFS